MRLTEALFNEISQIPNTPLHHTGGNVAEKIHSRLKYFEINNFLRPLVGPKINEVSGCQEQLEKLNEYFNCFSDLGQRLFDQRHS